MRCAVGCGLEVRHREPHARTARRSASSVRDAVEQAVHRPPAGEVVVRAIGGRSRLVGALTRLASRSACGAWAGRRSGRRGRRRERRRRCPPARGGSWRRCRPPSRVSVPSRSNSTSRGARVTGSVTPTIVADAPVLLVGALMSCCCSARLGGQRAITATRPSASWHAGLRRPRPAPRRPSWLVGTAGRAAHRPGALPRARPTWRVPERSGGRAARTRRRRGRAAGRRVPRASRRCRTWARGLAALIAPPFAELECGAGRRRGSDPARCPRPGVRGSSCKLGGACSGARRGQVGIPTGTRPRCRIPRATSIALRGPGRIVVVDEAVADSVPGEPESEAGLSSPDVARAAQPSTSMRSLAGLRVG